METGAASSKEAQAYLIDPVTNADPSEDTGLNSHFRSTYDKQPSSTVSSTASPRGSLSSNNPFRESGSPKHHSPGGSKERFPAYREQAFGGMDPRPRRSGSAGHAPPSYSESSGRVRASSGSVSGNGQPIGRPRRGSSLRERYPGDHSHQPLDIIRRDSKKASRSPHLRRQHLPGADTIDRLDPAVGGRAYHHEGPYDAALQGVNRMDKKHAPIAALESSNQEAIKATPAENVKDAVERHKPLDGVAVVPPGQPDRLGRTYNYEEGTDMMREGTGDDPGYKRWHGVEYLPEDLKGKSEPTFSLDRAMKAHKIDDNGIEMEDRQQIMKDYKDAKRRGSLDPRDPVDIAGGNSQYADAEFAQTRDNYKSSESEIHRSGSLKEGLKKRIGSIKKKKNEGFDLL